MKVFIDMDGVLCDLVPAILNFHGIERVEWPKGEYNFSEALGMSHDDLWSVPSMLWETLKPGEEIETLMAAFPEAYICTYALPGTEMPKQRWLRSWNINNPVIFMKDKWLLAGPDRLLIDDCEDNCTLWREAGGLAFCWPQVWNWGNHTIGRMKQLQEVLNG